MTNAELLDIGFFVFIAFNVVMWQRNKMVLRFRLRRVNEIYEYVRHLPWTGENPYEIDHMVHGTYQMMWFDLTRWTYHGFYPKSFEEEHTGAAK